MVSVHASEVSEVTEEAVHGFSGRVCEACGAGLPTNGRGQRRRFCGDRCRARHHSEARRIGNLVITRRRATQSSRPAARPNLDAGLLPNTHLARSIRVPREQTIEDRRREFFGAVRNLAPRLAADSAAERDRLTSLAPERVELAVPRDEYEASRRSTARLLGISLGESNG